MTCTVCRHEHAGPELAGICLGCPCTATSGVGGFKCQGCGHAIVFRQQPEGGTSMESAARARGWRVWRGTTFGGAVKQLVVCPACAGTASVEITAGQSWTAECDTCGASMAEDWEDDRDPGEAFTEEDARRWRRDHECEPSITIHPPAKLVSV